MTEFEQYFTGLLDGKIVACEKMKRIADVLLEQYYSPGEYHFDFDIAKRHIDFIEKFCKIPSGRIGAPLKLELFQKARFQAIFGFVDDNNIRQYNECLIVEGRKNGKTTETVAGGRPGREILFGPVCLDHEFVLALGIRPRTLGCAEQAFPRSLHDDQGRERLGAILYVYRLFLDGVAGGSVHETLRI